MAAVSHSPNAPKLHCPDYNAYNEIQILAPPNNITLQHQYARASLYEQGIAIMPPSRLARIRSMRILPRTPRISHPSVSSAATPSPMTPTPGNKPKESGFDFFQLEPHRNLYLIHTGRHLMYTHSPSISFHRLKPLQIIPNTGTRSKHDYKIVSGR
ncbi:MAG: hypothetical protein M2R45_04667 [Verrucomicrobia subdivision 3 bacterium]|nr:hypothetical protein [Limisphaerales bacterium]MCS1416589.1 hypothetical protein [Limisphaerales bacterium]